MQELRLPLAVAALVVGGAARGELPALTSGFRGDGAGKLVQVLGDYPRRHAAEINAAAFSPDARWLATAGGDRRIKLWDARTGEELAILGPAKGRAYALVFSPDAKRLAVASSSGAVTVWNLERRSLERTLTGHGAAVLHAAFSPSGLRLASAGRDQTVRFWNLASGAETARASVAAVRLDFRADDALLATAGDGRQTLIRADGASTPAPPVKPGLLDRVGPATAVALSPDGTLALAGDADGSLSLWGAAGRRRWKIPAHTAEVTAVAFSPDGKRLCSTSRDTRLAFWDRDGKPAFDPGRGHQAPVRSIAFAGEDQLVSGGADGSVRLWDLGSGAEIHRFALGDGAVWAVAVAGGTALAGTDHGRIHRLDLTRRRSLGAVAAHPGGVFAVAAGGGRVVSTGADGQVRVWDAQLRRATATLRAGVPGDAAAIAADGRHAAVGFSDGQVRRYHLPRRLAARLAHDGIVHGAAFLPDGRLVTASEDHTVRMWSDKRGAILWSHAAAALAVAAGPDDFVVSGGADGVVLTAGARWDLSTAADIPVSVAVSPSGRTFAVGTQRGVILVYRR